MVRKIVNDPFLVTPSVTFYLRQCAITISLDMDFVMVYCRQKTKFVGRIIV